MMKSEGDEWLDSAAAQPTLGPPLVQKSESIYLFKNFPSLINLISVDDFEMASKNKQCCYSED